MDANQSVFACDIEALVDVKNTRKYQLVRFLTKNFIENTHFIVVGNSEPRKHGGHNKKTYLLTEEAFELCNTSYNMKHKYVPLLNNVQQVRTLMSLENQTIGFITKAYDGVFKMVRQYKFGRYFVDLYFPHHNLVIECDEYGHSDRDQMYEEEREAFIRAHGASFIRFNPNEPNFDISNVLCRINRHIYTSINK